MSTASVAHELVRELACMHTRDACEVARASSMLPLSAQQRPSSPQRRPVRRGRAKGTRLKKHGRGGGAAVGGEARPARPVRAEQYHDGADALEDAARDSLRRKVVARLLRGCCMPGVDLGASLQKHNKWRVRWCQ